MHFSKILILSLLLCFITLLNSLNVEFLNGDTLDLKVLKADAEKVYAKHAKTLLIVNRKLIITKIVDQKGKVKYNSFHDIINLENEADLSKLLTLPEPPTPKEKFKIENRNFLYLNISTVIMGLGGGFSYERFINNHVTITTGYTAGEIFTPFSFFAKTKYSTIPLEVKFVPQSHLNFSGELGGGVDYLQWETYESVFFDNKVKTKIHDRFIPSFSFGLRYQPDKAGFAFKAGIKTIYHGGKSMPSLLLNFGVRF